MAKHKTATKGFLVEDEEEFDEISRTNHILGIGINQYTNNPILNNAVKDVKDFIKLMTTSFDFDKTNTHTLFDDEATRDNILLNLDHLATSLSEFDNLIIYFSGHGYFKESQSNGYWIPYGAEETHTQYISNSDIRDHLQAIKKAHHIFLISDACFSSRLFTPTTGRSAIKYYDKHSSRWGLTSGRGVVPDGKPNTNSPFAKELLKHLGRAAAEEKIVTVQTLCAQVTETVVVQSGNQLPIGQPLIIPQHNLGQFVFIPKSYKQENTKDGKTKFVVHRGKDSLSKDPTKKSSNKSESKIKVFLNSKVGKLSVLLGAILSIFLLINVLSNTNNQPKEDKPVSQKEFIIPTTIKVEGNTFEMGSKDGESDEIVKQVTVNDFNIGTTEITNQEYLPFLNERGNQRYINIEHSAILPLEGEQFGVYPDDLKKPVVAITYKGAEHFCEWLTEKTDTIYRLPSEAEWEFAAAAGQANKTLYSGGNDLYQNIMWFNENSNDTLHQVETNIPNGLGIYDMSGNASEWCADNYDAGRKVIRGGSFEDKKENCRITNRNGLKPEKSSHILGFRIAFDH